MSKAKHSKILTDIFTTPIKSNIVWKDVEAMLRYLGAKIVERGGSKIIIELNDVAGYFHRPHPQKETDKGAIVSLREFLINAGVTQDGL